MKVLCSICQQIWKTQQWPQNWKMSVFIPIPKKSNAKECSTYCTISLMSIESVMPSNHLILLSPFPPAFDLSQHRVFSNESALHIRWPKYWSFSFSISPSNNAVQGSLKSLLQNHSSKASILWCSAFFL